MRLNGVAFVKVHHLDNPNKYFWLNMALVQKMFKERDTSGRQYTVLIMASGDRIKTSDTSEELMRGGKP